MSMILGGNLQVGFYRLCKGKAEALNEQFKSVFTKEDLDNFPQIDDSGTPDITYFQYVFPIR
jgi:hypothetical protein